MKRMSNNYIVGFIGRFDNSLLDGQTVKCRAVRHLLENMSNCTLKKIVDFSFWKKNPIKQLINILDCFSSCEIIFFSLSKNGLTILLPLLYVLNIFFGRKIVYVMVGTSMGEILPKKRKWLDILNSFYLCLVESYSLVNHLKQIGLRNVIWFPNFKFYESKYTPFLQKKDDIYNFCTFSRVTPLKGIDTAVDAIRLLKKKHPSWNISLDIYGQVSKQDTDWFSELNKSFEDFISYKGAVPPDHAVNIISNYYALLFPTRYPGEGYPGTLLDALYARIPVIATDWRYNCEMVVNNETGLLYKVNEKNGLAEAIESWILSSHRQIDIAKACERKSEEFSPEVAKKILNNQVFKRN